MLLRYLGNSEPAEVGKRKGDYILEAKLHPGALKYYEEIGVYVCLQYLLMG